MQKRVNDPNSLIFSLPKGRMEKELLRFFQGAGISLPASDHDRQLIVDSTDGSIQYFYVKPKDVPTFVEAGAADVGVCGLDTLRESRRGVYEPLLLPIEPCRLSLCAPANHPQTPLRYESQPRIATSFPRLTMDFFRERGINAEVIPLSGSVELGPLVGLADMIVDIVQSGSTLRANGLVELRTIMHSQAVLIVNRASYRLKAEAVQSLISTLKNHLSKYQDT